MRRRRVFAAGALQRAALGLAALALVGGCGGDPALPEPSAHVRLWELPAAAAPATPGRAAAEILSVRHSSRFGAGATHDAVRDAVPGDAVPGGAGWHEVRLVRRAGEQGFEFVPSPPAGTGPLRIDAQQAWARALDLPARAGEALTVRVRARAVGDAPAEPVVVAWVVERREPFDASARLAPEDVGRLRDARRFATHELAGVLSGGAAELHAEFVVEPLTTGITIYLPAPLGGQPEALEILALDVERRRVTDLVAQGGRFPRLTDEHGRPPADVRGPVRLTLDREDRAGLLALPGARWRFELPAGGVGAARLVFALGAAARDPALAGSLAVTVSAGPRSAPGALQREFEIFSPADGRQSAWAEVKLELPDTRGEPLVVEFACAGRGSDPPLVLLAHPSVSWVEPAAPANVVLISLDTLRPDRLGCYGGDGTLTPRLDALAAEGLRFTDAWSTSSYTLPSHASMLTGQYPAVHGAVDITDRIDPGHSPLLAVMLAGQGYATAAFTGGGYISSDYGFAHGFDRYGINDPVWALDSVRGHQLLTTMGWERAPMRPELLQRSDTTAVADWISGQRAGRPFFLFLHTYIVHNYAPDLASLQRHGLLEDGQELPLRHVDREAYNRGEDVPRELVVEQYLPYYDATVGMADEFVGAVLDALASAGLAENTLVIVTSDHGEEFGEHGFFGHGDTLFEEAVRIPLIVRLPARVAEPLTVRQGIFEQPVSLVDIAPWALSVLGLPGDARMGHGPPLGPDSRDPPGRNLIFSELDTHLRRLSVVRSGGFKLHRLFDGTSHGLRIDVPRLHDLGADPGEQHDLLEADGDARAAAAAERLQRALDGFHEFTGLIRPRGDATVDYDLLAPDTRAQLEALGYLTGDTGGRR